MLIGYENVVMNNIEQLRKNLLKKFFIYTTPLCFVSLVLLYFSIKAFFLVSEYSFILLACFILSCLVLFVPYSMLNETLNNELKNKIIKTTFKQFNENIVYDQNNNKNYKPNLTNLLNKCSLEVTTHITSVTDVIYGKLADTNYTISEVSTRAKGYGSHFWYSSFYGIVAEINFPKNISNGEILIRKKSLYNFKTINNLQKTGVKLKCGVVYTNNSISVCDNHLFQNINQLYELYKTNKIAIHISNHKMIIAVNFNRELFPIVSLFKQITVPNYLRNISPILSFIETIKEQENL